MTPNDLPTQIHAAVRTQLTRQRFVIHSVNFQIEILMGDAQQRIAHATAHEISPGKSGHIVQKLRQIHRAISCRLVLHEDFNRTRTSRLIQRGSSSRHSAAQAAGWRHARPAIRRAAAGIPIRGRRLSASSSLDSRTGQLARHQVGDVGQLELLIQRDQVRLDLAGAHQVDAGEQHAIDVEQRLHPARRFLQEQLPLRLGEPEVVMRVMLGDAARERMAFNSACSGVVWTISGEKSCSST